LFQPHIKSLLVIMLMPMLLLPNQLSHLRLNLKRVGADSLGEIMMEDRD
jgi:hypothetical protein